MHGETAWNCRVFAWETERAGTGLPIVTRLVPEKHGFVFEWFDEKGAEEHVLRLRERGCAEWETRRVYRSPMRVGELTEGRDYEFTLCAGKRWSRLRFVRTGEAPGIVVNYVHPAERELHDEGYATCSPTIARVPSGGLIAMHDLYCPDRPYHMSYVFRSDDEGETWRYVTTLSPCVWPQLFVHRDTLYCMAVSQEYGDLLIGRSDDEGKNWTVPTVIMRGQGFAGIGPHKNPTPFVHHNGRIWQGAEYGAWRVNDHRSLMLSCGEEDDLLDPAAWLWGEALPYPHGEGMPRSAGGWIEGNAIAGPDGHLYNMLRINWDGYGKAALLRVPEDPEAQQKFVGLIDMPVGSNSKFFVHFDAVSGEYIALGTEQNEEIKGRLVMSMAASTDLLHWRVVKRLFDARGEDPALVGFQYPNFIISGEDLLVLTRAAINGAESFHNANHILFNRIKDFRRYL